MIEIENIDTWYPIIKGKGPRYSKVLKNIFLNFGVKGTSGYSFDSNSCYYYITKDGYVDSYLPALMSEKESFLEKFKNNIIDLNDFLIKQ
jgi:hypothetical protein